MKTIVPNYFAGAAPIPREIKFTDSLERDLISQELAGNYDSTFGSDESMGPLLQWIVTVALAIGLVFIIINSTL